MKPAKSAARQAAVAQVAERLEAELRRLGAWSATPLPPEAMRFTRAFGGDTMAFEQWIQFVLIPRLRELAASGDKMPPSSQLRAYAVREFDGREVEMAGLIDVLGDVDDLCPQRPVYAGRGYPIASMRDVLPAIAILLGWAIISLFMANVIAANIAAGQPVRVLAYAHYLGSDKNPWRGLTLQAWAWESAGSLRGYEVTITPPAHLRSGSAGTTPATLTINLEQTPPALSLSDQSAAPEFSAKGLSDWFVGTPGESLAAERNAALVFMILDALHRGTTATAIDAMMRELGETMGESNPPCNIKRYPASASTGMFFGVFCGIFLPPALAWMVWKHQRNMAKQRSAG